MAARQTRRQLQFTGFEMTILGVSFVVTITAVFFLGLFVGKRNAYLHAPAEDRVARVPVDDFTKYKRPAPVPSAKPAEPAVAAATPAEDAKAGDAKAGDAKAKAPAQVASAAAAPAAAPAAVPAPAQPSTTNADAAAAAAAKAKEAAAAKEAEAKKLAEAKKAAEAKKKEEEEKAAKGGGYTVQLLATRKEADADALVRKLKARGYAAYIRKVNDGAGAWYRVRVGSYGTFSDARAMADKCRGDLGLAQAFVSTE